MRLIFLTMLFAAAAPADIQFHARPITNAKLPRGQGRCEIRLMVDQQVEVSLRGDTIAVHTLTGADARDNGSECSAPLPDRPVEEFALKAEKRHGEVRLVSEPSARNGFTATVFIHDNAPGEGFYQLRISWNLPSEAPPGMSLNNATHYAARGHGTASLNETAAEPLGDVAVDIDRGGKALITFQVGRSGAVSFTGTVMSWEDGAMKIDAVADERHRRLPGPMYLYFDASKQIYKIAMDATNGQDQLRVSWERK